MPEVKRMVLASWASDRFAVESQPALRKPPELPHPVPIDEVLAALRELDGAADGARVQ
jgi:acetyl esterase/lipase